MPTLEEERIVAIADRLLRAAGAPDEHANIVARHMANANLAGHDSHGFIRVIQYLTEIDSGRIDPKGKPEVIRDSVATAQVNGNNGFGQVVATFATRLATEKARQYGVGMVTMRNLAHTGRIGAYTEMAANEGLAAIMSGAMAGSMITSVAPFGGRQGRLSTNPLSMSFPHEPDAPILLDFATSIAAEGKLRVYKARNKPLPEEWVLDKDGVPSKDPNDYYDDGALLPMGGLSGGHKGYALSFMNLLFGVVLAELGSSPDETDESRRFGASITVVDVEGAASKDEVKARVDEMVRHVKNTPPRDGFNGVLLPGEIEARTRRERRANGVLVEDATWDQVLEAIDKFGLRKELGPFL